MNPVALAAGGIVLYWSSLILTLGVLAWFALSFALYRSGGGSGSVLWAFFPFALWFSLLLSRALHWYCHMEQYDGFLSAMTRYTTGGYCLPGVLLGVILAALLVRALGFTRSSVRLLDAAAPGAALGLGLFRLSALFGNADRGKLLIRQSRLQHLPLAAPVTTGSGGVEYRFATFFWAFLLLMLLALFLTRFYLKRRRAPMKEGSAEGSTALLFLLFYSAMELVLDSMRYDSCFLHAIGFVSLTQIVSAVSILAVLVCFSIRSIRANGLRPVQPLLWLLALLSLGAVAYLEYLIQRHGNWYLLCYSLMSVSCLLLALSGCWMYRSVRGRRNQI